MHAFPTEETTFFLQGPAGQLEVLTTACEQQSAPTVVICHPHPLFGGTMNNKIVTTLARTFRELGLRTVRFNFRGVGESAGTFDNGQGELQDLLAIIQWVKSICPHQPLWLAGFSFGAAMSIHAATHIAVAQLVSIAPPVPRFNLPAIKHIACPWLVVQGDQDDIVNPEDVFRWVDEQVQPPTLIKMEGAGHFFHGRLMELRENVTKYLQNSKI